MFEMDGQLLSIVSVEHIKLARAGAVIKAKLRNVLTGSNFDVTHSSHPLLLPARTAAKVITIHDLNFLTHPDRTRAEIRLRASP